MNKIKYLAINSYYLLLAYLPFHALITTFIISNIGGDLVVKGLKDGLVFIVFLVLSAVIFLIKKSLKINKLMVFSSFLTFYILSITLIAVFNQRSSLQTFAGIVILLRPIWMFFVGVMVFALSRNITNKNDKLLKLIIIPSIIVVFFGALQVLVLPKDFLTHFGYGPETIKPYQTIDNNESFIRILSTLRGPNPLGAYLAMVAPIALYYAEKIKHKKNFKIIIYSILFLITLYGSHSRSAWVGLIVGVGLYFLLRSKNKMRILPMASFLAVAIISGYMLRNTNYVQNIIFHRYPNETSNYNSDDNRLSTIKYAIKSVNEKPFGHGVGSSGPASNHGDTPVIIENQFLDIGYQIGWVGLISYIGIISYVGYMLIKVKNNFALAHFIGLVSISVIALFWPVWTDDTIVLIWWGIAGSLLSTSIVERVKKQ